VLLVGACSNSPGGSDSASINSEIGGNGGALAPDAPAAGRATGSYDAAGQVAGGSIRGSGHVAAGADSIALFDSGYKIRTARMTVAVRGAENVAAKATEAGDIAVGAGGEVDADNRTSGPQASASLTLRVPPETLPDTLTALSKLGVEKSRTSSTTDVTQKVADVNSRVESAQQSIARLRLLFGHATKIGAIIQLESELNSREADLESLQAQQRSLARQTSMATVSLTLITAPKPATKPVADKDDDNGFVGGLKRGWDGFTGAAAWVAEAVGTVLPFLLLLLVLAVGARWAWPKLPRRTAAPAPAPIPAE
jgi:hypothetical protein